MLGLIVVIGCFMIHPGLGVIAFAIWIAVLNN